MTTAIGIYFAIVLVLALSRPVAIRSRWVQVVRFLLPSWRFFDELGELAVLHLRTGERESELGAWQPAPPPLRRSLTRVVLNADGNLALACESLVQQLMAEVAELDGPTSERVGHLPAYRLVDHFAAAQTRARCWQWRIEIVNEQGAREEALVAPVQTR